jgi:hypothetical protein|tara:strand:- start:301 stop:492 length:192 start_codon:yes stop_codon:yes gene_type:complete
MLKNKRFSSIEDARKIAYLEACQLECNVPIYMGYSDPPGYHLWNGHELVEWVNPLIEIEDDEA